PTAAGGAEGPAGGMILALDILPMEPVDGVVFVQGDFHEEATLVELQNRLDGRKVDVVLSDMAPNLSGIASSDSARVALLVELALEFAERYLVADGALVCKVFHGSGYSQLVERFKRAFRVVKPIKPKASRDRSAETFLVGIGLKARPRQVDTAA
ncbi:MAG TPA: RlmE family RNA methyltransferase, partial [Burkholderiaceae bacterium]|nr:RlmE family RNA methyltransferase [Burkholderiaceae bacterium]